MSLLSGLGNLGGIGKLLDPGAMVKDVVNGFLPKDMKVVGDIAGAVVDLKTGNVIGAAQLGMEAVKDLPQAAKSMQGAAAMDANKCSGPQNQPPGSPLEPSPPPGASHGGGMGSLFAAIEKLTNLLTDLLNKKGTGESTTSAKPHDAEKPTANNTPADGTKPATKTDGTSDNTSAGPTSSSSAHQRGEHVDVHVHTHSSGWRGRANEDVHAEPRPSGWRGEPRTPAPASHPSSASSAGGTTPAAASPASSPTSAPASPAGSGAQAAAPAKGETITSLDQIKGMSDAAIRDAVINGRISPEVAKDQTAMMVLQQRMQAITEMNNLMTGMLRALHDMQMAVIQNIRI